MLFGLTYHAVVLLCACGSASLSDDMVETARKLAILILPKAYIKLKEK